MSERSCMTKIVEILEVMSKTQLELTNRIQELAGRVLTLEKKGKKQNESRKTKVNA